MFELQSFTKKTPYIQKTPPNNKLPPKKQQQRSDLCGRRLGRLAKVVDFDDVGGEALVANVARYAFLEDQIFVWKQKTMDFFHKNNTP